MAATSQYVGFANLPNQVHRRMVKKGFEFTLMLVGESGLGKSTLVSSLFLIDKGIYGETRTVPSAQERINNTVSINPTEVQIEEKGVKLRLTIVDTPGFADSLTGEDQTTPIEQYIDSQFQQYLDDESGLNRRNITDTRVHCCFYFISPHSNGLRPVDIEFMKSLHSKVNIVPLIAKADTLTPIEIKRKKSLILKDIQNHQIRIYQLPGIDEDEDPVYRAQLERLKGAVPFAIVGSTETFDVNGKKVRGRLYPWGVVEIEKPEHSEFSLLRSMLISHMQDLQDVTHDLHYENYRAQVLTTINPNMTMGRTSGTKIVDETIEAKNAEIEKMKADLMRLQQAVGNNVMEPPVVPSKPPRHGPPPPPRRDGGGIKHLDV